MTVATQNPAAFLNTTRDVAAPRSSRAALYTGRVMSGLAVLFLGADAAFKLIAHPAVVQGTADLGFPPGSHTIIGLLALGCWVLYLAPRTALLGAVLWTGYLGGAIATHLRMDNPLFSHTLFPIYVAILLWGGLYLRDARVRNLFARTA